MLGGHGGGVLTASQVGGAGGRQEASWDLTLESGEDRGEHFRNGIAGKSPEDQGPVAH